MRGARVSILLTGVPSAEGAGTMRGRESPLALAGSYELLWPDFSRVEGGRYGTFRGVIADHLRFVSACWCLPGQHLISGVMP
jgi:hypothetical protein